ncbi:DUF2927 domain-containing protein [Falsihalocynthiibacter sp. BN13B15]|uniref:DUF2927 domain-containing protein n=1 Tax=Falsihalocynthiibacter sp. BN13B15 TaxID=3240871 RepID=UPI0035105264
MRLKAPIKLAMFVIGLSLLLGCEADVVSSKPPEPKPVAPPKGRSELSQFYLNSFSRLQDDFLVKGLLRTDGGGVDVAFTANDLAENFMKIAFFAEFSMVNGRLVAQEVAFPMRRWQNPVVINVILGETLTESQQRADQAEVKRFASRLERVTGHPIQMGSRQSANLFVLILNEDERLAAGPLLREIIPEISNVDIQALTQITKNDLCIAQSYSEGHASKYIGRALVIIRDEHPDLLRKSCIHEEIAQSLGLSNDSDAARPSIFNDDEEFGLLTTHDEYLLRILYDPRLTPGMDAQTARPIVDQIARELMAPETPEKIGRI